MWKPTHVQLIVHKARNLKLKGKSGTNDCYAIIQLGKEKYHTSIKEKSVDPEWNEECDFTLLDEKPSLKLCLYHRNFIGIDDFLGQTEIHLDQFNAYERPRKRWFPLFCKPSSKKQDRSRGEVEVSAVFVVQSASARGRVGVCTLDGRKRRGWSANKSLSFKNLSDGIGSKLLHKWPSKTSVGGKSDASSGKFSGKSTSQRSIDEIKQDPPTGATFDSGTAMASSSLASLAEEGDSVVESKQASSSELSNSASKKPPLAWEEKVCGGGVPPEDPPVQSPRGRVDPDDEREEKLELSREELSVKSNTMNQSHQVALYELREIEDYQRDARTSARQHGRSEAARDLHKIVEKFSNEDLVHLVMEQKRQLARKDDYIRDLEDYIDNLLVKVIESQPKLLQMPGREATPMDAIVHYSTMPRSHNQALPSAKAVRSSRRIQTFWRGNSPAVSPLKKLKSLMK